MTFPVFLIQEAFCLTHLIFFSPKNVFFFFFTIHFYIVVSKIKMWILLLYNVAFLFYNLFLIVSFFIINY